MRSAAVAALARRSPPVRGAACGCRPRRARASSAPCRGRAIVCSTLMPGQAERLAQARREDHRRLPQALDAVDRRPRVERAAPRRARSPRPTASGPARSRRARAAPASGSVPGRLVADAEDARADARPGPRVNSGISAGKPGEIIRTCSMDTLLVQASSTRTSGPAARSACATTAVSRVAQDDVAVPLVARRRQLSRAAGGGPRRRARRSSRCASLEAVDRAHAPACPARAGRRCPRRSGARAARTPRRTTSRAHARRSRRRARRRSTS